MLRYKKKERIGVNALIVLTVKSKLRYKKKETIDIEEELKSNRHGSQLCLESCVASLALRRDNVVRNR